MCIFDQKILHLRHQENFFDNLCLYATKMAQPKNMTIEKKRFKKLFPKATSMLFWNKLTSLLNDSQILWSESANTCLID